MLVCAAVAGVVCVPIMLWSQKSNPLLSYIMVATGIVIFVAVGVMMFLTFINGEPKISSAYTVDRSSDFGDNTNCILADGSDCLIRVTDSDYIVVPIDLLKVETGGDNFTLITTELVPHDVTFWKAARDEPKITEATLFVPEDCKEYLPDKLLNP